MPSAPRVTGGRPRRDVATRLAWTVALLVALTFAPNVVRETYLAVALVEDHSIRVDRFSGLHPDLFERPGGGTFINSNPGASIAGAVPYALARPVFEAIYRASPPLVAPKAPATYDDPRPNRLRVMNDMRARGLDVRLGLAAAAMATGVNVPLAVLATLLLYGFLCRRLGDEPSARWLALLFTFGTPVFFRSAFLNQNLLLAYVTLFAYLALTRREAADAAPPFTSTRLFSAGLLLGFGLLCDYSGVPILAAFGVWILVMSARAGGALTAARAVAGFAIGAAIPIAVLMAYQQRAFGSPWLPAQAYMPATELSVRGWFGLQWPQVDLLWRNLVDPGYGLLTFCPMLALAAASPWYRRGAGRLASDELALIGGATAALYLFSSSTSFAALQWNTGVRYLVPAAVLLFMAAVPALLQAPRVATWTLVAPTLVISLAVTTTRESVPAAFARIVSHGPELPWHTVLLKTTPAYLPSLASPWVPVTLWLVAAAAIWRLWAGLAPRR